MFHHCGALAAGVEYQNVVQLPSLAAPAPHEFELANDF